MSNENGRSVADAPALTKVFKALSDGTRREILRLLGGRDLTGSEIVANFQLTQPTISRHLAVLREAHLVTDRRRGQNVIYRLDDQSLVEAVSGFLAHMPAGSRDAASPSA
jgi:ArsR family transcriptional regulator, arsenate/arsenite/antimonite-responsive transcriptional repressor